MNNKILLSIVVPIYNVELYLERCLDSLVTQDVGRERYEIICINDGSTDRSGEILASYSKTNNIIAINKENGGVSSARNVGIKCAKGKYIWFVDADDFIKRNSLSKIFSVLENTDCDRLQIMPYSFNGTLDDETADTIAPSMSQRSIKNFLWTQILKKEHIADNQVYFDTEISYAEDAVFMYQIGHLLKNTVKIEEVIYFYRLRENSAMSQNIHKKIKSRIRAAMVCAEIEKGERFGESESAKYLKYISVSKAMSNVAGLPRNERKEYIYQLRSAGLFPLKYDSKYTPKTKMNSRSLSKRIKNYLSDKAFSRFGYCYLLVYLFVRNIFRCFRRRNR